MTLHAHATSVQAGRRAEAGLRPALTVCSVWLVLMAGANLAAPLYAVYADEFGFSTLVLTTIFATYAVVLVPALVVFGRLSDRFGRRSVILAALGVAAAALVVFAAAQNAAWLYGARVLQGLAVAMVSGAATAALVEFDPARDRRRAAMFAGLAQAGGSAAGPLVAGVLAQWAPEPLRLAFVVGVGATAACAVLTLTLPRDRPHADPWRLQLPRVPRAIRGDFARVSLTAATAWAAVALLLSIVPSYARELLDTHNLALLGTLGAVALAASCVTQVVAERRRPQRQVSQALGLAVLAAGLLAIVSASPLHSLALLLVGSVAAGAGHGVAFLNAQEELNELAPEERRGEVTAAFIACIYMLVASAVIATGLLDVELSLSLSVDVVACALVAVAGAAAAWQLRRRSA